MAYGSLSEFVTKLEAAGELKRIRIAVDPVLEITEVADREMKSPGGGKALLFENCRGARYPLLINAYGSVRRMALSSPSRPSRRSRGSGNSCRAPQIPLGRCAGRPAASRGSG